MYLFFLSLQFIYYVLIKVKYHSCSQIIRLYFLNDFLFFFFERDKMTNLIVLNHVQHSKTVRKNKLVNTVELLIKLGKLVICYNNKKALQKLAVFQKQLSEVSVWMVFFAFVENSCGIKHLHSSWFRRLLRHLVKLDFHILEIHLGLFRLLVEVDKSFWKIVNLII
jgi:hypothetical protein